MGSSDVFGSGASKAHPVPDRPHRQPAGRGIPCTFRSPGACYHHSRGTTSQQPCSRQQMRQQVSVNAGRSSRQELAAWNEKIAKYGPTDEGARQMAEGRYRCNA